MLHKSSKVNLHNYVHCPGQAGLIHFIKYPGLTVQLEYFDCFVLGYNAQWCTPQNYRAATHIIYINFKYYFSVITSIITATQVPLRSHAQFMCRVGLLDLLFNVWSWLHLHIYLLLSQVYNITL